MSLNEVSLIPFYDLSRDEQLDILNWRNNENVRKWMYNSQIICEADHFQFIASLKQVTDKEYFLLLSNGVKIGVVYFIGINKEQQCAEFGLYANPAKKGVGHILIETICDYAFNKLDCKRLTAKVFENNIKAIALYQNQKFRSYKQDKIDMEHNIICMELTYENWKF